MKSTVLEILLNGAMCVRHFVGLDLITEVSRKSCVQFHKIRLPC